MAECVGAVFGDNRMSAGAPVVRSRKIAEADGRLKGYSAKSSVADQRLTDGFSVRRIMVPGNYRGGIFPRATTTLQGADLIHQEFPLARLAWFVAVEGKSTTVHFSEI